MNREVAKALEPVADLILKTFNQTREKKPDYEIATGFEIVPHSDDTASILIKKNSNKIAIAFCFYNHKLSQWFYFFPTDSQFLGMRISVSYRQIIEDCNFAQNFPDNERIFKCDICRIESDCKRMKKIHITIDSYPFAQFEICESCISKAIDILSLISEKFNDEKN